MIIKTALSPNNITRNISMTAVVIIEHLKTSDHSNPQTLIHQYAQFSQNQTIQYQTN